MDHPNPELQLAEEFVQQTNCHIFLTGKAGTGKTTFLHTLKEQTAKQLVVTAPTGVAAINAGGVTLHSFFQIPFGPYVPGSHNSLHHQHRVSREKRNIMNSLDLLVIDEISMVRADLLDCVDSILRRYRRSSLPFGGVQLLMIGDLHQLPPVVKRNDWQILRDHYASPYFFSATALQNNELITIELQHIYRQSDGRFIELLNRVRDNRLDGPALQHLNSRYQPDFNPGDDAGYITLCTHNRSAEAINTAKLGSLQAKMHRFDAEVEGDFPESNFPTAGSLELKTGAQVMFVRNDSSDHKRYFNGKIGTISRMSDETIEIDCPGDAEPIEVETCSWDNIEYTVDPDSAEIAEKVIGTFSQYPLKLAWAITIHKSQGLTFDKAIIDAQDAFAHGQVYVALSRCRTIEGLVLSTPLGGSAVKTDATIETFVRQARQHPPSPEQLAGAKIRYQQQLLLECFSFQRLRSLLGRLATTIDQNGTLLQVLGVGDLQQLRKNAEEAIFTIGDNFKRQLQGLFQDDLLPTDDPIILERLDKAAAYFQDQIETLLKPVLTDLVIETDNKQLDKKTRTLHKLLTEETTIKLAAVQAADSNFSPSGYLQAVSVAAMDKAPTTNKKKQTAIYSEADVSHPELFQTLRQWRTTQAAAEGISAYQVLHQKTLIEIAIRLPDSVAALKQIHGIGDKLAARYGEQLVAMVEAYRQKQNITEVVLPKPKASPPDKTQEVAAQRANTKELSLALFSQGLTIPQIAQQRELTPTTIEGHLAHWVRRGRLPIDQVVELAKQRTITRQIEAHPTASLKQLKEALGDNYSYGEIKLVQAHLAKD